VRNAGDDEMTPPRSLGRYAPAVRLRRALGVTGSRMAKKRLSGNQEGRKKDAALPFFHRLRPPDKHHEI